MEDFPTTRRPNNKHVAVQCCDVRGQRSKKIEPQQNSVSQKTSPTFLAVTRESIVGFS